ncbi:hypothetical protein TPE_0883 [Treponema pedis str. T A4]|uniref:Uncharacterized protein n=1 Tax=Treponema pedis str. T A4 TaxID=1291379 RepID=S6A883_9SPIR|nr:hypothetical protein TPE_0883 [Treponema pedis str. T A4]
MTFPFTEIIMRIYSKLAILSIPNSVFIEIIFYIYGIREYKFYE